MSRLIVALTCLFLATAAGAAQGMTVLDVLDLLEAGIGEAVILDQIEAEDARFRLSTDDLIALKSAGASDALLQDMIARDGGRPAASKGDWTDAYYGPSYVRVNLYYDPFGYHWYGWPHYFTYYYPFRWSNCGFYYAGWWSRAWCGWGPTTRWYWDRYHWHRNPVRTDGRHAWNREPAGRYVSGREATGSQGRVVSRRDGAPPRQVREPLDRPAREVTRDNRRAPAGVDRPMNPRSTRSRTERPAVTPRSGPARPAAEARPARPGVAREPARAEPARPARPEASPRSR